jgi:hypothetical protein
MLSSNLNWDAGPSIIFYAQPAILLLSSSIVNRELDEKPAAFGVGFRIL